MKKREYWAWLSSIEGMYYGKISRLLKGLKTPINIFEASENELMKKTGIEREEVLKIINSKRNFDSIKFFENLQQMDIKFVTVDDKDYPAKLMPYDYKPYYLFYKGKLPDPDIPTVAMIGARACSDYGRRVAKDIARELSIKGVQIISGMARGIDTYSGVGALEGSGLTYAVLGCGADICYPMENIELYHEICKKGGVISEYPPGTKPLAWHFPQRNRIISGLADKVVVVEAKEKSGSLITVEWALEQGKDVMAVPGRIDEKLSNGCNRLIKAGAGIINSTNDIVEDFYEESKYEVFSNKGYINIEEKSLEKDLTLVYSELSLQPKSIYELIENTGLEYGVLTEILLRMQLMGLVEQPIENYYLRFDKKNTTNIGKI